MHFNGIVTKFAVSITESQERLSTFWLSKLHKRPYKALFIANSSSCKTTSLFKVLTPRPTAIKNHWIKYIEKNLRKGINKLFLVSTASTISAYDLSTPYTTLPHDLIKINLLI